MNPSAPDEQWGQRVIPVQDESTPSVTFDDRPFVVVVDRDADVRRRFIEPRILDPYVTPGNVAIGPPAVSNGPINIPVIDPGIFNHTRYGNRHERRANAARQRRSR